MTSLFITKGCKTSTGGTVLEGRGGILINNQPVACINDKTSCSSEKKQCRGWGFIYKKTQDTRTTMSNGKEPAQVGDGINCGCSDNILLPSSHKSYVGGGTTGNVIIGDGVSIGDGVFINCGASGVSTKLATTNSLPEYNRHSEKNHHPTNATPLHSSLSRQTDMSPPMPYSMRTPENTGTPDYPAFKVEFAQKPVELAVLSLEEAEEFANHLWTDKTGEDTSEQINRIGQLWEEYDAKNTIDTSKKLWDGTASTQDAYKLAKGLGGLGVAVYVKKVNGTDYVVIKGYKKHLKTLVKGHRWRANNPQVVQLGLGTKNLARNLLNVSIVVDIIFSVGINAVDVMLHDEKTMVDFVGQSGVDIVKGIIATGFGVGAAIIISVATGGIVLISGLVFAGVSFGTSIGLNTVDNSYGVTDTLVEKLKEISE